MTELQRYSELHRAFSETSHGQKMGESIRFAKYNLSDMPNDEWEKLLGRDVNNLEHMSLTHGIAVAFIRYCETYQPELLTDEEKKILLLTAITHDWGEAIRGDVSFGDKTKQEEAQEVEDFNLVIDSLSYGSFTYEEIKYAQEIAFDHHGSKLGRIFYAIERLGYMRTALKASEIVLAQRQPDETTFGLIWLVADVLSNHMHEDQLLKESYRYDALFAAITAHHEEIDAAFDLALRHPTAFENYGEEAQEKNNSVQIARKQWREYKQKYIYD